LNLKLSPATPRSLTKACATVGKHTNEQQIYRVGGATQRKGRFIAKNKRKPSHKTGKSPAQRVQYLHFENGGPERSNRRRRRLTSHGGGGRTRKGGISKRRGWGEIEKILVKKKQSEVGYRE